MGSAILTVNAGSSSLKAAAFDVGTQGPRLLARGSIEALDAAPHLAIRDPAGAMLAERRWVEGEAPGYEALLGVLLDGIEKRLGGDGLAGVGHRVVHGGRDHAAPARVTDRLLDALEGLVPLAPLHQSHNLAAIRAVAASRPDLKQAACFDTAFHHGMDPLAARLPLPREYDDLRRYGFHGLSYEFIALRLREVAPRLAAGRVIAAHLGNGASLCALRGGRSVDTTMSLTALDGLVMGTRCGALDPGVVLHLAQARGLDVRAIEDLLYHRSGLLGVSGLAADMRALHASDDPRAREAIALFVFRFAREAGGLVSSLGGLDGLVFTAGIGEHDPDIRAACCDRLAWLGIELDDAANRVGPDPAESRAESRRISAPGSRVEVWVVPTDEEAMIARHTLAVVRQAGETPP